MRAALVFIYPAEPVSEGCAADVLKDFASFRRVMDARAARLGCEASEALASQWPALLSELLIRCTADTAGTLRRRVFSTTN